MESRIVQELKGNKSSEMTELLLDNCKAGKISGLSEEFSNLTILSLIDCELESLEGLPKLPMLSCINLSDNRLTGGLEILADKCPHLAYIILSGNNLKDLGVLQPLVKMDKLLDLEIIDTGLDDLPEYRQKVFQMLPQLKHLDGAGLDDTRSEEGGSSDDYTSMDELLDDSTDDDEEAEIQRQRNTFLKSLAAQKGNSSAEVEKDVCTAADDESVKPDQARGIKRQHDKGDETDEEPDLRSS